MSKYWEEFYKSNPTMPPSSFAQECVIYMHDDVIDIGCGNGRDLNYFLQHDKQAWGVDASFESDSITKSDIVEYMEKNKSPHAVYARFFWHSIDRDTQLKILDWTKEYLFIEARTTEDKDRYKMFPHDRNYVDVPILIKDLKGHGYQIIRLEEGEFSPKDEENPHLVRIIAKKQ